jgi:hypothetical protein
LLKGVLEVKPLRVGGREERQLKAGKGIRGMGYIMGAKSLGEWL